MKAMFFLKVIKSLQLLQVKNKFFFVYVFSLYYFFFTNWFQTRIINQSMPTNWTWNTFRNHFPFVNCCFTAIKLIFANVIQFYKRTRCLMTQKKRLLTAGWSHVKSLLWEDIFFDLRSRSLQRPKYYFFFIIIAQAW